MPQQKARSDAGFLIFCVRGPRRSKSVKNGMPTRSIHLYIHVLMNPEYVPLPAGRRSGLVREEGVTFNAFFVCWNTAFANKFASTAYGQNQKRICV